MNESIVEEYTDDSIVAFEADGQMFARCEPSGKGSVILTLFMHNQVREMPSLLEVIKMLRTYVPNIDYYDLRQTESATV